MGNNKIYRAADIVWNQLAIIPQSGKHEDIWNQEEIKALLMSDILEIVSIVYLVSPEIKRIKIIERCNNLFDITNSKELICSNMKLYNADNFFVNIVSYSPRTLSLFEILGSEEYILNIIDYEECKILSSIYWRRIVIVSMALSYEEMEGGISDSIIPVIMGFFLFECVQNKLPYFCEYEQYQEMHFNKELLFSKEINEEFFEDILDDEWLLIRKENEEFNKIYERIEKVLSYEFLLEMTKISKLICIVNEVNALDGLTYDTYILDTSEGNIEDDFEYYEEEYTEEYDGEYEEEYTEKYDKEDDELSIYGVDRETLSYYGIDPDDFYIKEKIELIDRGLQLDDIEKLDSYQQIERVNNMLDQLEFHGININNYSNLDHAISDMEAMRDEIEQQMNDDDWF